MASMSRVEAMLSEGKSYDGPKLSRIEAMLEKIIDDPDSGGGGTGGGTVLNPDNDFDDMDVDEIFSYLSTNNGDDD